MIINNRIFSLLFKVDSVNLNKRVIVTDDGRDCGYVCFVG